jgi:general transcription factor 3C polypeptide 5 (transcription factor C subunit 1)
MSSNYAKEHSLDIPHISCIEFPLKVNNIDRAFAMVGGEKRITDSIHDETTHPLELRFTKNIHEHPVTAKVTTHEQLLVKISVPKKLLETNKRNIQKTLLDIHERDKKPIHVTPVAIINKTFRFREMSDFQYQTANSKFAQQVDSSVHSLNYNNIKKLDVYSQDLKPWEYAIPEQELFDLPPPPKFSSIPLPFNFNYKKNSATITKEGKITTRNKHIKLHSIIIKWSEQPPKGPSPELVTQLKIFEAQQADNIFFKDILETLKILHALFEKKPIWIRKHLEAVLPVSLKPCLKYSLPQIAYTYTKGPWRQAYIKFGIDPKSSPKYAVYQTEGFRVPNFSKSLPKGFISEVPNGVSKVFKFNGDELPVSLLFQIQNITDPMVKDLLSKSEIRTVVDFNDGWYDSLTIAKLRALMRYKLRTLVDGTVLNEKKVDHILYKMELSEADQEKEEGEEDNEEDGEEEENNNEDQEELDEEELEKEYELDITDANYDEIMKYLKKLNPKGAEELGKLSGLLKQANIDLD